MIAPSLIAILRKDLTMFFRSKFSSAIIILLPLLIVLAAGYAFDSSNLSNVYVGVYSNSSSNLTQKIVLGFQESGFLTKNYSLLSDCINAVKMNEVQICSVFSKDLPEDQSKDLVTFYVDYSRINLADTLLNNAKNSVYAESSNESKIFVQDLIDIVDLTKGGLPKIQTNLDSALLYSNKNKDTLSSFNISVLQFDTLLESLNETKDSLNDSSAKENLSSAIILVSAIKANTEQISLNLTGLISAQEGISGNITFALENLNPLVENFQSKKISSAQSIVSPIRLVVEPITQNSKSRDYLIPVLISLIALFGSLLLSSTFVLKERKTIAYFRNFMTPTKEVIFVFSTYLVSLIILIMQFILVFFGIKFILGMKSFFVSLELISVLFAALTVFIFIGIFIGYLFRSEEGVIFASMITSGIFLFFSNTILPIENVSQNLMKFSFLNPLVLLDSALKKTILFQFSFSSISSELIALGEFFIVFALLAYFARIITKRML